MTESIKTLYKKIILENSRNPFNQSEMEKPDLFFTAYNPMCGDKFNFYLKLNDNKVIDASFTGYGCSISKASSSILVKKNNWLHNTGSQKVNCGLFRIIGR